MGYVQETIKLRAPSPWANLPEEYKLASSSKIFKRKIKNWKCETCSCRLCQTFQKDLGLSNFIYLLTYLIFCLFVVCFCFLVFFGLDFLVFAFFYCLFHWCSDVSSVSSFQYCGENAWINFQFVALRGSH